jgi:hypothetical protein
LRFEYDIHCVASGMESGKRGGTTPSLEEEVNGDEHYQSFYM